MDLFKLDEYLLEDIESSDHPSDFVKRDNLVALILRLPVVNSKIDIKSFAYIIEKENVYFYNKSDRKLEKLGNLSTLQELLEEKIEKLIQDIKLYLVEIDKLEESLYSSLDNSFMEKWLLYKKDVSLINRLMFYALIVIELFINYLKKNCQNYNNYAFEDILEEVNRVKNLSKVAVEKLDYLYDFYRAKVDEKMNKNVYYLTLLSGIFLPLTLVTGFFGMNTGGLPFVNDSSGTVKVIYISIILELLFFLPFILMNLKKIKKYTR